MYISINDLIWDLSKYLLSRGHPLFMVSIKSPCVLNNSISSSSHVVPWIVKLDKQN